MERFDIEKEQAEIESTAPISDSKDMTKSSPPCVEIDFEYYRQYLEDYDISLQQKHELISELAKIMLTFVDLGFGIAPGQVKAEADSGQDDKSGDLLPELLENLVSSEGLSIKEKHKNAVALAPVERSDS